MDFNELIKVRRSVRAYRQTDISEETLKEIARAASMAPSWKNSQTARTYIAVSGETLAKVRECLPAFNQKSSANASALIVTTFVRDISGHTAGSPDNECGNLWGAYDLGLHNAYMILKASELGLDTLIMGLRDADALRTVLGIPENEEIMAVLALGKRESEPTFRPRKGIDETTRIL